VEEFLDGGNLADYIENNILNHDQIKNFGICLAEALLHLDRLNLVHRDIKPDNIMFQLSQMLPKLVDFGLVRDLTQSSLTASWAPSGPGTPLYSAPEQLNNNKAMINWRTDQFSLGLVLGKCLNGYHPFQDYGMTDPQIVDNIGHWNSVPQRFTNDATSSNMTFLLKMLEPWPINRFNTPEKLIQALR
jgi:Serine/threonine protein kinase